MITKFVEMTQTNKENIERDFLRGLKSPSLKLDGKLKTQWDFILSTLLWCEQGKTVFHRMTINQDFSCYLVLSVNHILLLVVGLDSRYFSWWIDYTNIFPLKICFKGVGHAISLWKTLLVYLDRNAKVCASQSYDNDIIYFDTYYLWCLMHIFLFCYNVFSIFTLITTKHSQNGTRI